MTCPNTHPHTPFVWRLRCSPFLYSKSHGNIFSMLCLFLSGPCRAYSHFGFGCERIKDGNDSVVTQNNTFLLEIPSMIYQNVYTSKGTLSTVKKNTESTVHIGQIHSFRHTKRKSLTPRARWRICFDNKLEMEPYWLYVLAVVFVYKCALTSVYLVSISRFILFLLFSWLGSVSSVRVICLTAISWTSVDQFALCVHRACECVQPSGCVSMRDSDGSGSGQRCRAKLAVGLLLVYFFLLLLCRFHQNIINDVTVARTRTHFIEVFIVN